MKEQAISDKITEYYLKILLDGVREPKVTITDSLPGWTALSPGNMVEYIPDQFTNRSKLSLEDLAKSYPIIVAAAYFFPELAEVIIFGKNP